MNENTPENCYRGGVKRHLGIDLLRIVAMLMVCVLHVNWTTGALDAAFARGHHIHIGVQGAESVSLMAVALYAMITGYVCVQGTWKLFRYLRLWMQVAFYTVGFIVLRELLRQSGIFSLDALTIRELLFLFLPIPFASAYWYFTAYTVLFLVMPYVNSLLSRCTRRELAVLIILLYALRAAAFVFGGDSPSFNLLIFYLIGAHIHLYPPAVPRKWLLAGIATGVLLTFVHCELRSFSCTSYAFPSNVLAAVSLFILFARMEVKSRLWVGLIGILAPFSFGVYLVHVHPCVWAALNRYMPRLFGAFDYSWWLFVVSPVILYLACTLVDACRAWLFRLCRADALADAMERGLLCLWEHTLKLLQRWFGAWFEGERKPQG